MRFNFRVWIFRVEILPRFKIVLDARKTIFGRKGK